MIKTGTEITANSTNPTEPNQQPDIDDDKLKNNLNKSFAQIVGNFNKTDIEDQIFINAIASAEKHKIKLKAGRKDKGYGNCAFESVINNINDRACYKEQLRQSPNWYRHIWMEEMKNRIILGICTLNPGYSDQEINEGFEVVKRSGVYEVDFFGDMIIPGIVCGVNKIILIFHTSENLQHDPISVIYPKQFDDRIEVDNEDPVVLAYNNYHYENLHPVDEQDKKETIKLVNSYMTDKYHQDYGFTRKDIKYLISPNKRKITKQTKPYPLAVGNDSKDKKESIGHTKMKINLNCEEINSEPEFVKETESSNEKNEEKHPTIEIECAQKKVKNITQTITQNYPQKTEENNSEPKQVQESELSQEKEEQHPWIKVTRKCEQIQKVQNKSEERFVFETGSIKIEELHDGTVLCGVCMKSWKRIIGHLKNNRNCSMDIDLKELNINWT